MANKAPRRAASATFIFCATEKMQDEPNEAHAQQLNQEPPPPRNYTPVNRNGWHYRIHQSREQVEAEKNAYNAMKKGNRSKKLLIDTRFFKGLKVVATRTIAWPTLFDFIHSEQANERWLCAHVFNAFVNAVRTMHLDGGTVHRDLHSKNIFVSVKGEDLDHRVDVKIFDFDRARKVHFKNAQSVGSLSSINFYNAHATFDKNNKNGWNYNDGFYAPHDATVAHYAKPTLHAGNLSHARINNEVRTIR